MRFLNVIKHHLSGVFVFVADTLTPQKPDLIQKRYSKRYNCFIFFTILRLLNFLLLKPLMLSFNLEQVNINFLYFNNQKRGALLFCYVLFLSFSLIKKVILLRIYFSELIFHCFLMSFTRLSIDALVS